tara:strand:- start:273 stop:1604 length:1332 start_codon:yes stop_codon:yes gene_type:complete
MEKFPKRREINIDDFKSEKSTKALYGLPSEIKFCSRCIISNQRPNSAVEFENTKETKKETINFSNDGICDACLVKESKVASIDWDEREKQLIELCNKHRSKDGSYDCLVPGSGGKDSFYQSHILKYKYGMNPLTVTWAPNIYTDWGWKNFQSWIHSGFDNYLCTPNGKTERILTRLAVENLFHPFQAFMMGQKYLGPRMAAMHKIPLVFYGEDEAEYGNPIDDTKSAERDYSYFSASDKSKIFIAGTSLEDLNNNFGITQGDLHQYMPVDPDVVRKEKVEVHYLGYYLKWHPQSCYYYAVENGGFIASPERTPGTYSKYNSIDDKIDDFHFHTYHTKFGIGRATYDAAQEIRSGDITREEGQALVQKFDGEFPERFADEIFKYLSLPEEEFPVASKMFEQPLVNRSYYDNLSDAFRSPHVWKYKSSEGSNKGEWVLRHGVWDT